MFNVDVTGLFYNLQPSKAMTYKDDSHHGGTKSKQRVTVLLGCNADGTDITSTGEWQVQQTLLIQNYKKAPHQIYSKFEFMDDFSHF
jgi:hypothetical protein